MDNIRNTILITLDILSINPDSVESKTMEHLIKIESVISSMFDIQQRIIKDIKTNKPSILKVVSESNIARQTVYNNPILKEYIENRIKDFSRFDISNQVERLNARISELEKQLKQMEERDVREQLMIYKMQMLEEEVNLRVKQNIELNERYNNAVRLINETPISLKTKEVNNVVNITKK